MDMAIELPPSLVPSDIVQNDVNGTEDPAAEGSLQETDIHNIEQENRSTAIDEESAVLQERLTSNVDHSDDQASKLTMPCNTGSPRLNRKHKPPDLEFPDSRQHHQSTASDDSFSSNTSLDTEADNTSLDTEADAKLAEKSSSDEEKSDLVDPTSPSTPLVTLPKHMVKILDAGISSPLVRRSSRIEEILNLPDVKAAIVRDEGFEMRSIFHKDPAKALSDRLQTPGEKTLEDQFNFEPESPAESESISGSDVSSILSARDSIVESNAEDVEDSKADLRPRMEILHDSKSVANPLDRIADSLGPSTIFNNSSKKERTESPRMSKKEKKRDRSKSQEAGTNTTASGKQTPLLSRFKFSSLRETRSCLEGWDSLTRALARVGAVLPSMPHISVDDFELHPKVNPILKRTIPGDSFSEKDAALLQEPGSRLNLPKKTVSFSRLPTEAKVKNAADCVARMCEGQQFVKLRSNSRAYNRFYWFDHEHNCLRWEPSKKDSGKARVFISQMKDVRLGKNTELFLTSDIADHFPDEYCLSIIHGESKTLDLVANSADEANIWITGIRCLMSGEDVESLKSRSDARDNWLSTVFDGADINGDGYLDEDESVKLLTTLSDGIRELSIKQRLQEYFNVKTEDKTKLSRQEFVRIFKDVATRPEVYFLLVRYSSSHDRLSVNDLTSFLESEQGIPNVTKKDCLEIITKYEPSEFLRSIPALGIDGFTKYLISEDCNLFDPKHSEVCQDMNQPLSHYYIASSHNTYLMEDQIAGPSDISAYVRALLRCCRCVELDCWDGTEGEPVVCHGHTRSNSIPFVHVIKAINESAFHNSPYPVIICIENHCSKEQQKRMAQILKNVLGKKLFTDPVKKSQLPSPESLKNRFLVRAKKLPVECSDVTGYVTEEDEGFELISSLSDEPDEESSRMTNHAKRKQLLTREFSEIAAVGVANFNIDLNSHHSSHSCQNSCSIHENVANDLVKDAPEDFVSHTKRFLTRVYPSGLRRDSGNFNPQDYWNCGVQIASLNYQTPGLMMDINDGKFSMNGGCGYVLKPTVMREKLAYFNAEAADGLPSVPSKLLHLRIISGQNFPKPRGGGARGHVIDPYVLIELFGFPPDCSDQRTCTALNNSGDSPFFDELFEFRLLLPSLALVRFVVLDDDFIGDEFIGQYTIPFECLQPGYRHLKLRSLFDEPLDGATLFVHVAVTDLDLNTSNLTSPFPNLVAIGTPKTSKRPSQARLQKQRSRKEIFSVHIYDVNIPDIDSLFRSASENLQLAASLCGGLRHSLTSLREVCGAPPLASIKQCIRALAKRNLADVASTESLGSHKVKRKTSSLAHENGASKKRDGVKKSASADANASLRRQTSDTSQSSNDSGTANPIRVQFMRNEKRIWLEWKGVVSSSDSWKKVGVAVDALVANCLLVLDKSMNCCNFLTSIYDKAEQLFDDRPDLFQQSNPGSELQDAGTPYGAQNRKHSKAKKHPFLTSELAGKRVPTTTENFIWNCSSIKGQRDTLYHCQRRADEILTGLWSACVQCGLAGSRSGDKKPNGSAPTGRPSANVNSNNNSPLLTSTKQSRRRMGRLVRVGSSFTRLPSRKPKLRRSLSDDTLPAV